MTVGRPRIFDETELELDGEQLWALFRAGIDAGYTPTEMGNLVGWLEDRELAASRVTVAKYRKILAELVPDGRPPRRRKGSTVRRGLVIAAIAATGGSVAHAVGAPEPVRASVASVDGSEAPIMYDRVNRRRRRRSGASGEASNGPQGQRSGGGVWIASTPAAAFDAHAMASAA